MTTKQPVDVIVFDLDGTLVKLDFTGEGMENVRRNLRNVFGEVGINRDFKPLLTDLEEALTELSTTVEADTVDRIQTKAFEVIEAMERDAVARQDVYDGAREHLETIAASDAQLAVATNNTRGAAQSAIENAGFPQPDVLVAVDDVGRPKPHPDMLEMVANQCDSIPESIVMIGDRESDAQSAYEAFENTNISITTILINNDSTGEVVDHTVPSIVDAFKYIEISGVPSP